VAGAVTGGGLTIIANAPNPAGVTILRGPFEDEAINPLGLLVACLATHLHGTAGLPVALSIRCHSGICLLNALCNPFREVTPIST
jgi:hypothetical protein